MVLVRVAGHSIIGAVEFVSRCLGGTDGTAGVADCAASRGTCASFHIQRGSEGTGYEDGGQSQELKVVLIADG